MRVLRKVGEGEKAQEVFTKKQWRETFDKLGEDNIHQAYLHYGTTRKFLQELCIALDLAPEDFYGSAQFHFYRWLHKEDKLDIPETRWQRWRQLMTTKAHVHIDEMQDKIATIDEDNYSQRRVEIYGHDIAAQRLSPKEFGNKVEVDVKAEVTLASEWAQAMTVLAEKQAAGEIDKPWERAKQQKLLEARESPESDEIVVPHPDPSEDDDAA